MGSPVSPIVVNMFMEDFEQKAISTAPAECKPRIWKRFVDDTLAVVKKGQVEALNRHLNSINENIKFTHEVLGEDNTLPFLDALFQVVEDGSLQTSVYRKKTHTNQYLQFTSHHPLTHKLGVVRTLLDRCNSIVSEPEGRTAEENTIRQALSTCGYPAWTVSKVKKQISLKRDNASAAKPKKTNKEDKSRGHVVLPYIKGLSENLSRIMRNYHVSTSYKPHTTLRRLLVHPKDKIAKDEKCDVVYKIPCHNCDKSYIGETGRQFQVRREEHVSDVDGHDSGVRTRSERVSTSGIHHKSAMTDHATELNHTPNWHESELLAQESPFLNCKIHEAIWLCLCRFPNYNRMDGA